MSAPAIRHMQGCRRSGQALVEFALLAPLIILMLLLSIDFGRLVYTYGAIAWAAREGARLASLEPQKTTDCPILQRVESVGRGFPLLPDPNSLAGNSDPNNPVGSLIPRTPPVGTGYIYIFPAVATKVPQDTFCAGAPRKNSGGSIPVSVSIQYTYAPLVPLFQSFLPITTMKTISVVPTEY